MIFAGFVPGFFLKARKTPELLYLQEQHPTSLIAVLVPA
jgi:hypothetical protein